MFAVTNIDDLVVLTLFFGRAIGHRRAEAQVVAGQYLGFVAILTAATAGGLGVGLLPDMVVPYFGLLPLIIGLHLGARAWRSRGSVNGVDGAANTSLPTMLAVAAVTFSNGGDNIGVYVPVFAAVGPADTIAYALVFLGLVAVWCAIGRGLATHPTIAAILARWDHIVLPLVLIAIGANILVRGGAFGL
ncbi:cadmium resistance transporter [Rhodococcus sp. NPDC127528]|uniref:cadmium resistance transporter n=1 Tax=unclassified Rhodococcus (in: high G+C Gram-positive bacteria) TaxID=192944 RepID=UPI00363E7935